MEQSAKHIAAIETAETLAAIEIDSDQAQMPTPFKVAIEASNKVFSSALEEEHRRMSAYTWEKFIDLTGLLTSKAINQECAAENLHISNEKLRDQVERGFVKAERKGITECKTIIENSKAAIAFEKSSIATATLGIKLEKARLKHARTMRQAEFAFRDLAEFFDCPRNNSTTWQVIQTLRAIPSFVECLNRVTTYFYGCERFTRNEELKFFKLLVEAIASQTHDYVAKGKRMRLKLLIHPALAYHFHRIEAKEAMYKAADAFSEARQKSKELYKKFQVTDAKKQVYHSHVPDDPFFIRWQEHSTIKKAQEAKAKEMT